MVLGAAEAGRHAVRRTTDDDWEWLQADAAKAARFLGYLPFDQITDQRNAEPVIRVREPRPVEPT